ncbi:unnamed protein product [Rotaria socialis]|uniref:Uncharacterized protein n=1 Tax=Rotaria socialis TaxID=392032 RepID=A0A817WIW1_9BILA|nr:unnamed protein product [Rotaria socialis]CAF3432305.1 unnamed protein product [Rotaria socialis]CAF3777401.1 unnamed protein product [Rotaria socialis]CAF3798190.1 unnamed protein product [Rotaria socialis]CAF4276645.1 unnamed protein product [Rotaria socialis]
MKIFFILFIAIILPICAVSRCQFGCTCYDDSNCEYYCNQSICQQAIPLWRKCSGYYIHPRECGLVSYCDPNSGFTCQLQKNYGELCTYSYSCLSEYCDYKTNTCQSKYKSSDWLVPIVLPSILVFVMLLITCITVMACRQRRRTLAYCQNPYIILPPDTPYPYQNACTVTEALPPPYPGRILTPAPKTYQS